MSNSKRKIVVYDSDSIRQNIHTIRDAQVMLDRDLAEFYSVETKVLNQAVKRNNERFPKEFMFQLSIAEWNSLRSKNTTSRTDESLRSQIVTSKTNRGGRRYAPYVFTEQGIAMLAAVLRSETAVKISIQIINAFIEMRRFLATNAGIFQRLNKIEQKQLETDQKFEKVFNAIQSNDLVLKQGIFFDGQVFDAYKLVSGLIRKAKESILLIDNYIDEAVLDLFAKKKKNVAVTIFTKKITKTTALDVKKFNLQYPSVKLIKFSKAHDRFLIIDNQEVYHFGASLKDLGKKWFAFSKMDKSAFNLLESLKNVTEKNFDEDNKTGKT